MLAQSLQQVLPAQHLAGGSVQGPPHALKPTRGGSRGSDPTRNRDVATTNLIPKHAAFQADTDSGCSSPQPPCGRAGEARRAGHSSASCMSDLPSPQSANTAQHPRRTAQRMIVRWKARAAVLIRSQGHRCRCPCEGGASAMKPVVPIHVHLSHGPASEDCMPDPRRRIHDRGNPSRSAGPRYASTVVDSALISADPRLRALSP